MASTLFVFVSCGFLHVRTPKTLVYAAPVDNEQAIHHSNVHACLIIRNYPSIFEKTRRSMTRHAEACVESPGEHSEHFL